MRISAILAAVSIAFVTTSESSLAGDSPFQNEWIVRMQVEKLERQFMYRGSNLNKVAKITVDYYKETEPENKTLYEFLWFNDGKPIGLERKNKFDIPEGKAVKVQIKNKKQTSSEAEKAIADAILRISLDAFIKRTPIISFKVPDESYNGIVSAMNQLNCIESQAGADEEETATVIFSIETETKGGPQTTLCYY